MVVLERNGEKIKIEISVKELAMLGLGYGTAGALGFLDRFGKEGTDLADNITEIMDEEIDSGMN